MSIGSTWSYPVGNLMGLSRRVEWHMEEGETFEPIKHAATVRGKVRHILLGERVALNMLARCSGIATKCAYLFPPGRCG